MRPHTGELWARKDTLLIVQLREEVGVGGPRATIVEEIGHILRNTN